MTRIHRLAAAASLSLGLALGLSAGGAQAEDAITVVSWGGAYTASQVEAFHKPFTEKTGIIIQSTDYDGNVAPVKAQTLSGNVTWDVVDVELPDAIRLCDEGALELIDAAALSPAPDGTSAEEDFLDGTLYDCAVANVIWATVTAYNSTAFDGDAPTTIADFFDLDAFPGKRGMRKTARSNLEMALMADGVAPEDVYPLLETKEGRDRAFAKLDTIKDSVVWWDAGAQPPQLLADGEVVMTTAFNGRIFNAVHGEGQPFEIVWDGQVWDIDLWVIPAGTPKKAQAMEFIRFATGTEAMANQLSLIAYGPTRASALPLIGTHPDYGVEMLPNVPNAEANLTNALKTDPLFWADFSVELEQQFNAWLVD